MLAHTTTRLVRKGEKGGRIEIAVKKLGHGCPRGGQLWRGRVEKA